MTSPASALKPRWSLARCQFILICAAALIDRELKPEEQTEVFAIASRTPTLTEISQEVIQGIWDDVFAHHQRNDLMSLVRTAIDDLPKDPKLALSTYAHAADVAHADRRIDRRELRFLNTLAKDLKLRPADRRLVDEIMDLKNRH